MLLKILPLRWVNGAEKSQFPIKTSGMTDKDFCKRLICRIKKKTKEDV